MATVHAPRKSLIDVTNSHDRTRSIPPGILSQSKESLAKVLTGLALDMPKAKMHIPLKQEGVKNCLDMSRRSHEAPGRISTTMKPLQQIVKKYPTSQIRTLATCPAAQGKQQNNILPLSTRNPSVKLTPSVVVASKEQLAHTETKRSEAMNVATNRQVPPKTQTNNDGSVRTHSIPPSRKESTIAPKSIQSGTSTTIIKTNLGNSTVPQPAKTLPKPLIRTQTALSILPQSISPIDQIKLPFNTQLSLPPKVKRNSIGALFTTMPVQAKNALPKIEPNHLEVKSKKVLLESNETTVNLNLSNDSQAHNDFVFRPAWQTVTISAASLIDLSGCQRKMASAKIVPDTASRQKRLRNKTARPARMTIKAVFFDLYGVYVKYLDNESALALIRKIITTPSLREKIFDYERGKYSCEECLDVVSIVHPPIKEADNLEAVDFWTIVAGVDENIEKAIRKLKENGYKVGILCNNAYWTPKREKSMIPDDLSLFDVVVESCKVGYRKSDPEIYWLAAEALGLECHECVLVDDSMLNVHGAMDQGMYGIKQHGEDSKTAVEELENLLYVKLH